MCWYRGKWTEQSAHNKGKRFWPHMCHTGSEVRKHTPYLLWKAIAQVFCEYLVRQILNGRQANEFKIYWAIKQYHWQRMVKYHMAAITFSKAKSQEITTETAIRLGSHAFVQVKIYPCHCQWRRLWSERIGIKRIPSKSIYWVDSLHQMLLGAHFDGAIPFSAS